MIAASGRFDLAFTCTDSTGAPVAPTGTPTGTLVKNGTDLGTTVTVTMSTAQGVASCTIPSDAVNGDRFYIRVSAVISAVTYVLSGPVSTVSNTVTLSPTTHTGATIPTVTTTTNLTNAPTSGDLTSTMKASVTTAATSSTPTVTLAAATHTGAVIPTVTNLTNAPTSGDLTSTMKASVTAAVPSATAIRTEMDTNSTQLAAILAAILATNNLSSLANIYGPGVMEVPDSGSRVFKFTLAIKDAEGKAVNLDSLPTITVTNESGTSRAAGLSSVTAVTTGKYTFTYTQSSSATSEQLTFESAGTVSGEARPAYWVAVVADYDSTSMLVAIDAALALVKAKTDNLPGSPAAVGSAMTLTGAYDAAKTAATQTSVNAIQTDVTTLLGRITANLFSGITYLKNWLGTLAGKTADATTLAEINATTAGATYANTTDSLEAIRDNTGSGGITQGDIDDIVDGVSASLTAPGFAASIAIQEGTYATVADVEARLTVYGVTLAADVDEYDGTRGSDELQMIEVAIEYANSLIDEHIVDLLHPISNRSNATFTRPSGVSWLRDRCVDIACYRLATLGGRTASDVLAGDYASALERLKKAREQTIRIPNLIYTSPTRPYATEYGGGIGIVRRAGT